jgi:glycosyltransferase involved in cell wall biosynthesis
MEAFTLEPSPYYAVPLSVAAVKSTRRFAFALGLDGDDPAGFADKVIRLLNDRGFAEELGRTGQRSVKERYSWQVSGQALDDALHTLIRSTTSTVAL